MAARLRWTIASLVAIALLLRLLVSWFNGPTYWFASAIAFSPDGKQVAVGTYRWQRIPPPDTPRFLVGEVAQSVRLLDPQTGLLIRRVEDVPSAQVRTGVIPEPVSWISFSRDGSRAAVGHWDGTVTRYRTSQWDVVEQIGMEYGAGPVRSLGFLTNDESLWIAYRNHVVVQDPSDPSSDHPLPTTLIAPGSTSVSDDGRLLAVGSNFGQVSVIDLTTRQCLHSYRWDARTGDLTTSWDSNLAHIACKFVPGSSDLVVAEENGEHILTRIIDTTTGNERRRFPARRGQIRFSPDGRVMAIGGGRGLSLFETGTWGERFRDHEVSARDLAFSPDSQTLVVGTTEGEVLCLNVASGEVLWSARVDDF